MKTVAMLLLLPLSSGVYAQTLTPEQLRAQLDERAGSNNAFQAMLNDPDPSRSRAAMELMIESKDPQLTRLAIDHGLLSALPEVRAYALRAFLDTRPTLLMEVNLPEEVPEEFERNFRESSHGTILDNNTATYKINVGTFDTEQNCYLETGGDWCGVQVSPNGVVLSTNRHWGGGRKWVRTNVTFQADGRLIGATTVHGVIGGFPTILQLTP